MNIKANFSGGIKAIAMQGAEAAPIKGVIHAASAIRAELSEGEGIRAEMKTGGYVKGLDGKSAYQIAVENGFEGTEEEWLASLKGEPGQADAEQVKQIITDYLEKNPVEGVTPEQVEKIIADYLERNPIEGVTPEQVKQTVESALQQAKESGEFDGAKGDDGGYYAPSVDDSGILTWEASKAGMPAVSAADIKGPKGDAGYTPVKGVDYFDGKDGYTPVKGIDYFDGNPGDPGTPGLDGISPTVSVQDISGGHRVTITDKDGEKTFDVMDGKDCSGGGASVQADWAVNDESDPAFVKNRTHYDYQAFDIRWDGDKTGKFALDMSMLGYSQGMYFVKVSDSVLSAEEVIGATAENVGFDSFTVTEDMIDMATFPGAIAINNNIVSVQDQSMINAALGTPDGYITNGTYFYMHEAYGYYVARFVAKPDVVEIPVKFLPKNLFDAAQSNWNENDPKSTAYVQNRTHWLERPYEPIVWDGSTDGRDSVDVSAMMGYPAGSVFVYKVSDHVLTKDEITASNMEVDSNGGKGVGICDQIEDVVPDAIWTYGFYAVDENGYDLINVQCVSTAIAGDFTATMGINIPSTGTYCMPLQFTANFRISADVYHTIDSHYLPESCATKEYVNNLITGAIGGSY